MGTSAFCRAHIWHTALLTSRQEKGKKVVLQSVGRIWFSEFQKRSNEDGKPCLGLFSYIQESSPQSLPCKEKPVRMHPALKLALLEWRTQSHRTQPTDFVFPSRLYGGRKALDLAAVLKRKIRPAFEKVGVTGVGCHTFRHTAGTVLAELGEHQLTIRDYLRHANLSVTNKYLQAASKTKRNAQARLVEAILPVHMLPGKTAEAVAP